MSYLYKTCGLFLEDCSSTQILLTFMLGELANGSPKAGDYEGNRLLISYHENLRKFKIMLLPIHTTPPPPQKKKKNPVTSIFGLQKS